MAETTIIIGNSPSTEEQAAMEAEAALVLAQAGVVPAVPEYVSMGQARCALIAVGMYDEVLTLMASLPETHFTRVMWEYASQISRHGTHMDTMQPALGLTDEQVDDLFIAAALIT